MRGFAVVSALLLASIATGVGIESTTPERVLQVRPASVALPGSWIVSAIAQVNGHAMLFGARSDLTNNTDCALLPVETVPLAVGEARPVSCEVGDDLGGPAALDITIVRGNYALRAHVAIVDAMERVTLGPTLMEIPFTSTTRPVWAEANGTAWLYDVATLVGPLLLQISTKTGAVEHRIRFPVPLVRLVLVATDDGVWLGVTPGGAGRQGGSPIYFVPASSGTPRLVWSGGASVVWAYGDATTAWFALETLDPGRALAFRLIAFTSSSHAPVEDVALPTEFWYSYANDVIGTGNANVWTITWPGGSGAAASCGEGEIVNLNLRTGVARSIARLPAPAVNLYDNCSTVAKQEMLVTATSIFILEGTSFDGGYRRLYEFPLDG